MVSHLLRDDDNSRLYDATAPLLNIFQTAAVLEVSMGSNSNQRNRRHRQNEAKSGTIPNDFIASRV